jgi:hypothetical protein
VQRRYDLIANNHRTRMGRSDNADHENVFSDLSVGRGCEIDEHERSLNKRASDRSLEEARWRTDALPWIYALHFHFMEKSLPR